MQKLLHIKHVFFDLDHTLWDFETNSKKTYEYIFKQNNILINIDQFAKIYKPINHTYWKLYREEKVSQKELKYARLKDTFDALEYSIADEIILKLAKEYLENLPTYNTLFKGTIELLEYLKPKYKLHIITNGFHEIQSAKLENSKIAHYFDEIITSESVFVKKPNPKIFFHALKKTKAYTYESIMIGDNLEADIYGAKNVGIQTIFCNFTTNKKDKRTITVHDLNQIKQYL
ncbi:MAG TPA: noncanonical pyrimidine nucleotidase, YjjG family [Flavobacteriaceae bacterium]|nr:noncanonical pyrimidine nucleotidase, YjjG family [Flavobacteriaceae bacterium]HIP26777.1 noncanonical pyrimidine nucleotidase, YjjG family [Flavobacteriaceae bacterium]